MDQQQHTRRIREKLEMAALAANQATATLADVRTAIDCAEAEGFRVTCAEAGVSVTPDQRIGTYYLSPNGEQGYLYCLACARTQPIVHGNQFHRPLWASETRYVGRSCAECGKPLGTQEER